MKGQLLRLSLGSDNETMARLQDTGAHLVRFGDDVLVVASNDRWSAVRARLDGRERGTPFEIGKSRLHLVVQKGRVFQLEHPDVPVLVDKGRFLVVDIKRSLAKTLTGRTDPCFGVAPLPLDTIVFETVPALRLDGRRHELVDRLLDRLDVVRLQERLDHLVSWPTRLSTSSHYSDAVDWALTRFDALGYTAHRSSVDVGGGATSANVVATVDGTSTAPRRHVIVEAHLDSINTAGGTTAIAPGADDNASGSAGVLELAEAFAGAVHDHDLTFLLLGGEEQGLHGSRQFVAALATEERQRVIAVINMDMIGSINTDVPGFLIEGASISQSLIDRIGTAAATYTDLQVQTSLTPFASDHVPFIDANMPAVLTIEAADGANENIHTASDTLDTVSASHALEILKANAAAVADLIGIRSVGTSPGPAPEGEVPTKGGFSAFDESTALAELRAHVHALRTQLERLAMQGRLGETERTAYLALHDRIDAWNDRGDSGRDASCGCSNDASRH